MVNNIDLQLILEKTSCNTLYELSKKTGIHYNNLYKSFVYKKGNLKASSIRKITDLSNGELDLTDLYTY